MYISVATPHNFYCQRCNATGLLSRDLIGVLLNDTDHDWVRTIQKGTKKFLQDTNIKASAITSFDKLKQMKYPRYQMDSERFRSKKGYLEERLGVSLLREDMKRFKVVNSVLDTLVLNKVENVLRNDRIMDVVDKYDDEMLGYLTTDASHLLSRYTNDNHERRYYAINLFDPIAVGKKLYTIESQVDLLAPEVNLVLAEGFFDITGVYSHFYREKDNTSRIFGAINGRGFSQFIYAIFSTGLLNINLDIYADNDINVDAFKRMLPIRRLRKITLHYNQHSDEKDFGVPLKKIKDKRIILK